MERYWLVPIFDCLVSAITKSKNIYNTILYSHGHPTVLKDLRFIVAYIPLPYIRLMLYLFMADTVPSGYRYLLVPLYCGFNKLLTGTVVVSVPFYESF